MINDNGKRNRSSPIAGSINIDAEHFGTSSEAVTTQIRHETKFRFMFGIINSICRDYFDEWCMCATDWSHFQEILDGSHQISLWFVAVVSAKCQSLPLGSGVNWERVPFRQDTKVSKRMGISKTDCIGTTGRQPE